MQRAAGAEATPCCPSLSLAARLQLLDTLSSVTLHALFMLIRSFFTTCIATAAKSSSLRRVARNRGPPAARSAATPTTPVAATDARHARHARHRARHRARLTRYARRIRHPPRPPPPPPAPRPPTRQRARCNPSVGPTFGRARSKMRAKCQNLLASWGRNPARTKMGHNLTTVASSQN